MASCVGGWRKLDEVLGYTLSVNDRFKQAVGRQPVRSVHASAGHFADGVEVRHGFSGASQKSSPDVIHTNAPTM